MMQLRNHIAMLLIAVALVACGTDTSTTPTDTLATITKSDLRPDTVTRWLYYSFADDAVVAPEQIGVRQWDIKLPLLTVNSRTIDIMLNSGTVGNGSTTGCVVSSRWENVTRVLPAWNFRTDDTATVNRVVPNCVLCPQAMFTYTGPPSHAIMPSPDQVLVLRLADGSYVKMQITSVYQGAVTEPTATTPIGFYTMRYAKGLPKPN
ncbi:MAG: hypothetical protein FGM24_05090 [Candidatus Kapabacteria bacterium]|nr:hypothetical protein [Candidatus Kapabacteria bacterium]